MNSENILRLINSHIQDDVILGFTHLSQKSIIEIKEFFEFYGQENERRGGDRFITHYILPVKKGLQPVGYIETKDNNLIWVGRTDSCFLRDKGDWQPMIDRWKNYT